MAHKFVFWLFSTLAVLVSVRLLNAIIQELPQGYITLGVIELVAFSGTALLARNAIKKEETYAVS